MVKTNDFFNKLANNIVKNYFPTINSYHDDKNYMMAHYAIELFNNNCLTYHELVKRLAKACDENTDVIHSITKQYIEDFGGYIYNEVDALNNFASKFDMTINVSYQEDRRRKSTYYLTLNNISISPQLDYNGINNFLLGWDACINNK